MPWLLQAASKALKEREAALLTLHAIEADLEKRRHTIVAIEEEGQKVWQPSIKQASNVWTCGAGTHSKSALGLTIDLTRASSKVVPTGLKCGKQQKLSCLSR